MTTNRTDASLPTSLAADASPLGAEAPGFWGSYVLGMVDDLRFGPAIVEYLERIEETMRPFHGVFLIHGAPWQQVEGDPIGAPVLMGFPSRDGAKQWYESAEYQRLSCLRIANSSGRVFVIHGVGPAHRSTDIIGLLAAGEG